MEEVPGVANNFAINPAGNSIQPATVGFTIGYLVQQRNIPQSEFIHQNNSNELQQSKEGAIADLQNGKCTTEKEYAGHLDLSRQEPVEQHQVYSTVASSQIYSKPLYNPPNALPQFNLPPPNIPQQQHQAAPANPEVIQVYRPVGPDSSHVKHLSTQLAPTVSQAQAQLPPTVSQAQAQLPPTVSQAQPQNHESSLPPLQQQSQLQQQQQHTYPLDLNISNTSQNLPNADASFAQAQQQPITGIPDPNLASPQDAPAGPSLEPNIQQALHEHIKLQEKKKKRYTKIQKCKKCLKCFKLNINLEKHKCPKLVKKKPKKSSKKSADNMPEISAEAQLAANNAAQMLFTGIPYIESEEPLKKCDICDQFYKDEACLGAHLIRDHGMTDSYVTANVISNFDGCIFKCKFCKQPCKNEMQKIYHEGNCKPGVSSSNSAQAPAAACVVAPDGRFVCEVCNKSYRTRSILRTHKITHGPSKPFTCDVCKRGFNSFSNLKNHRFKHTGQSFPCQFCGKSYSSPGNLKTHLGKVHSNPTKPEEQKGTENNPAPSVSNVVPPNLPPQPNLQPQP